jgi:glycosyltransferase involved in cell wall biosynthesis
MGNHLLDRGKMITILIITDNQKDQINGVVTTFNNIEIVAASDGYRFVYLDPRQFNHINCPGYAEVKLSWPWAIGKKIQALQPDYIHIATEGPIGLAARIWLNANGYRYNTSYHTKFPEFLNKLYRIPESITYAYLRWFHKDSNCVLTTTPTMVDELKSHGFVNNVVAWTRGVNRGIFTSKLREPFDLPQPILLTVNRVSKEKNLDAFCSLDFSGTKIVVGDGPYLEELKERYPTVHFVGKKTGVELARYFASADVFVFPSLVDTFGIVIIESLAVGTPVAAFDVPGPKDIITNGVDGYIGPDLTYNVERCLTLDRTQVEQHSQRWTWENCWAIFKNNLIKHH